MHRTTPIGSGCAAWGPGSPGGSRAKPCSGPALAGSVDVLPFVRYARAHVARLRFSSWWCFSWEGEARFAVCWSAWPDSPEVLASASVEAWRVEGLTVYVYGAQQRRGGSARRLWGRPYAGRRSHWPVCRPVVPSLV